MQIFARLTKVDEAQRTVTGIIANEALDRSGEVFDYESSKPLFEKWSGAVAKATDGKSVGNVRAMHGNVVAGVVKQMDMDDEAKAISVCAKIVDDNEWNKVLGGCYTGFSIGGSYARKWKGDDGLQRYTADPVEVSIVDLPCNPDAQFSVIKADGTEELCKFVTTTDNAEALAKWAEGLTEGERAAVLAKIAPPAAEPVAEPVVEAEPVAEVAVVAESSDAESAPTDPAEVLLLAAGGDLTKAMGCGDAVEAMKKWSDVFSDLAKAQSALAEREAELSRVNGQLAETSEALAKAGAAHEETAAKLQKVAAEYAQLLTKAAPPKGLAKVVPVNKDTDAGHEELNKLDDTPVLQKDGSVDHQATALKLMKLAHRR